MLIAGSMDLQRSPFGQGTTVKVAHPHLGPWKSFRQKFWPIPLKLPRISPFLRKYESFMCILTRIPNETAICFGNGAEYVSSPRLLMTVFNDSNEKAMENSCWRWQRLVHGFNKQQEEEGSQTPESTIHRSRMENPDPVLARSRKNKVPCYDSPEKDSIWVGVLTCISEKTRWVLYNPSYNPPEIYNYGVLVPQRVLLSLNIFWGTLFCKILVTGPFENRDFDALQSSFQVPDSSVKSSCHPGAERDWGSAGVSFQFCPPLSSGRKLHEIIYRL